MEAAEAGLERTPGGRQAGSDGERSAGQTEGENEGEEEGASVGPGDLKKLRGDLATFPIGYPDGFKLCCIRLEMIIGWLLTIGAISLGAPFWFDLLGKVAHLRGSGTREADRARKPRPAPPAAPSASTTEGGA